jgi:hypothetical protein
MTGTPVNPQAIMHSRLIRPTRNISLLLGFCLLAFARQILALGGPQYVENSGGPDDFCVAQRDATALVYVDTNDYPGVLIAAHNLCADVSRATDHPPAMVNAEENLGTNAIIIGTVGKSQVIDKLVAAGKIDVSSITNKWESYFTQVVPSPLPGVANSLVIVGSDKRGTIYGIYDLSAAMACRRGIFGRTCRSRIGTPSLSKPANTSKARPPSNIAAFF